MGSVSWEFQLLLVYAHYYRFYFGLPCNPVAAYGMSVGIEQEKIFLDQWNRAINRVSAPYRVVALEPAG